MTWFCQQCKQNNTEHQEYCRNCRAHWSKVWVKPKRRSRSKSAKATSYRDAGHQEPTEENVDWNVFPLKAPWIPTTPSSRVQGKKGETTVGAGSNVPSAQHVVQPAQVSNTDMALTAEEEKILENLKGLQEAGLEFSMDMQQKLEILVAKQAAGAKKPLTHGHLNSLEQSQIAIDECSQKNRRAGSRMVKLCPEDYGEGQAACGYVSVLQSGSSRGLQQQVGGTLNVEERDDRSILVHVGTGSHSGAHGEECGCGKTDPQLGRSHRHRECRGCRGFDRRHGRRGTNGGGKHCSQQVSAQESQAFSWGGISNKGSQPASKAESSRCERHESQGERTEHVDSMDSGVDSFDPWPSGLRQREGEKSAVR